MRRLDGRTPRGERVAESVPRTYGAHTSLNGATSLGGVEAVVAPEGAVDPEVFNAYLEQILRQTFKSGDALVLDDLTLFMLRPKPAPSCRPQCYD